MHFPEVALAVESIPLFFSFPVLRRVWFACVLCFCTEVGTLVGGTHRRRLEVDVRDCPLTLSVLSLRQCVSVKPAAG